MTEAWTQPELDLDGVSSPVAVVPVARDESDLHAPAYEHSDDAGADLRSSEDLVLAPGERRLVHTGIHVHLDSSMLAWVTPRSGLAARHGITITNSPGLIDPGYRGEIQVCLQNTGSEPFTITRGDRIAQIVFQKFVHADFKVVGSVDDLGSTTRGNDGFGSTGR